MLDLLIGIKEFGQKIESFGQGHYTSFLDMTSTIQRGEGLRSDKDLGYVNLHGCELFEAMRTIPELKEYLMGLSTADKLSERCHSFAISSKETQTTR